MNQSRNALQSAANFFVLRYLDIFPPVENPPQDLTAAEIQAYATPRADILLEGMAFAHVSLVHFSFTLKFDEGGLKSAAGRFRNPDLWQLINRIMFLGPVPFLPGRWGQRLFHGTVTMEFVSLIIIAVSAL